MPRCPGAGGFTVLELLIVLSVIGILVALSLTVGGSMVTAGRARLTEDTLRTLDTTLGAYAAAKDQIPPPVVRNPNAPAGNELVPIADAENAAGTSGEPALIGSLSWYLYQVAEEEHEPAAIAAVDRLPSRLVRMTPQPAGFSGKYQYTGFKTREVLDAWGRPLRYVHPALDGVYDNAGAAVATDKLLGPPDAKPGFTAYSVTQLVRSDSRSVAAGQTPNSDGGVCVNNRPYFYSPGPDGDPSTVNDNVYSTRPQFTKPMGLDTPGGGIAP